MQWAKLRNPYIYNTKNKSGIPGAIIVDQIKEIHRLADDMRQLGCAHMYDAATSISARLRYAKNRLSHPFQNIILIIQMVFKQMSYLYVMVYTCTRGRFVYIIRDKLRTKSQQNEC